MTNKGEYVFFDYKPQQANMASEVLKGLGSEPKFISPKYFYDQRGSELFERITELDEYYVTRTEMALFDDHLPDIARSLGRELCLIEYGSGSSMKIRKLLETISPKAYVPVDISGDHLQENARALHRDFPQLNVYPVCADITQHFALPPVTVGLSKVGFFPGSSIGNFEPRLAQKFLSTVRETTGVGGALIIGVDRKKPVEVLEDAYNDAEGVTAAFNLNVLRHINQALGADFDVRGFTHVARYNEDEGCIQMFLQSKRDQTVHVAGETIRIANGEILHTENSYKYDPDEFLNLASNAGFSQTAVWSDARDWFSLYLLQGC